MNHKKFDHFILTRFNVRITYETMNPNVRPGIDETWLKNRFELYERLCLPSVARQTTKSFRWLLFMDVDTPVAYKTRMSELSNKYSFIIPIYCENGEEQTIVDAMNDIALPDCTRIMTRLDNDDAIHSEMLENIQNIAMANMSGSKNDGGFFITFPLGYTQSKGDYYLQRFRCNPFISFVADASIGKSIFYWYHTKIAEFAPVIFSYKRPMWCQVIHHENVLNSIRGVYWPWGKYSGMITGIDDQGPRSFTWQCREFWRSFKKYILRK